MRLGLACLAVSALAIAGFWAWLGVPLSMPQTPLSPGKALLPVVFAVPRQPDSTGFHDRDLRRPDRGRFIAARQDHRLRAHLFDRLWPRPDCSDRRPPRPQSDPGSVAV